MYRVVIVLMTALLFAATACGKQERQDPKDTEVWQPEPAVVSFGSENIPSDAIVLLGKNSHAFEAVKGGDMPWSFEDGILTVKAKTGAISSEQSFGDMQLHLEWRSPAKIEGKTSQQVGNSGVFLQSRYEVQILDSYENRTYSNGQAASIYKQSIPLVNASKPPLEWQSYDIIYKAPMFDKNGSLLSPAYVTILHNGVLVQNHVELKGATEFIGPPSYIAHGPLPIMLQDHGNPIKFRNIWVRELD